MQRTRIKICGLTQPKEVLEAVASGADAIGFNCYAQSPRYVAPERLRELAAAVPPFVTPVLLFVNAQPQLVDNCLVQVPQALLQFHGNETVEECERFGRPYIRAVRMDDGVDLLDCLRNFASARALLVDAPAVGFGGGGAVFDWARLPPAASRERPLILAGGLHDGNVSDAIRQVRPYAVDVSSGVEQVRGIKSAARIRQFCDAVRAADQQLYAKR